MLNKEQLKNDIKNGIDGKLEPAIKSKTKQIAKAKIKEFLINQLPANLDEEDKNNSIANIDNGAEITAEAISLAVSAAVDEAIKEKLPAVVADAVDSYIKQMMIIIPSGKILLVTGTGPIANQTPIILNGPGIIK